MNDYQVQVVYKDAKGWERCIVLNEQTTEQIAFEYAENAILDNSILNTEIMVHKNGYDFWKVKDQQGRIVQRPTTEALVAIKREEGE